jgi:hypothetical protein
MSAKCAFCDKVTTYGGIPKHLFSSAHSSLWKGCIKRYRKNFLEWITEYEAGRKTIDTPLPSFPLTQKGIQRYRVCFGCKKVSDSGHKCSSPQNLKDCVDMYKSILNEEEETVLEETLSSEEVNNLSKQLEKAEKKVTQLEKLRDDDEQMLEKAERYRYALKDVLEQLSFKGDVYEDIKAYLEEDYKDLEGDIW